MLVHGALDKRGKIFGVITYLETKLFKIVQAKFCKKFSLTIIPRKAKFIIEYTNFKLQGQ